MEADTKRIIEDLQMIKAELQEIRESMPDKEMFLTTEEAKLLEESYRNEKEGRAVSSKQVRKQLGI